MFLYPHACNTGGFKSIAAGMYLSLRASTTDVSAGAGTFAMDANSAIFEARYSCRKLSTGWSWAARIAGNVPNKSPTHTQAVIAIIAEIPEIGIR